MIWIGCSLISIVRMPRRLRTLLGWRPRRGVDIQGRTAPRRRVSLLPAGGVGWALASRPSSRGGADVAVGASSSVSLPVGEDVGAGGGRLMRPVPCSVSCSTKKVIPPTLGRRRICESMEIHDVR